MSRPVLQEGLPEWLFTPRMAAATGIAMAACFIAATSVYFALSGWWSDATGTAPACFQHFARPIVPGSRPFMRTDRLIDEAPDRNVSLINRVLDAEQACLPEGCPASAKATYQKAIKSYVDDKSHTITQLDTFYGTQGLEWGLELYGRGGNIDVTRGFRARYAAGHVPLDVMPRFKDAARMILYRPASEFLPCRKGQE